MASTTAAAWMPTASAQNEVAQKVIKLDKLIKLGLDNYAMRDMKWTATQLIAYAARLKSDSLFITDLGPFEKTDDLYLGDLRRLTADKGLQIQLGS